MKHVESSPRVPTLTVVCTPGSIGSRNNVRLTPLISFSEEDWESWCSSTTAEGGQGRHSTCFLPKTY